MLPSGLAGQSAKSAGHTRLVSLLLAAGAKPDAGVEDMASTVPRTSYMEVEDLKAGCLSFPIR